MCVLILMVCVSGLLLLIHFSLHDMYLRPTQLTMACGSYFVYTSLGMALFPYTNPKAYIVFCALVGIFWMVSSVFREADRDRLCSLLFGVALLSSFYAIAQFYGHDMFSWSHRYFGTVKLGEIEGSRPCGTFGHPNLLGGFYTFVVPILVGYAIRACLQRRYLLMISLGGIGGISLLALVLSRTRSSWIATGIGLALWSILATQAGRRRRMIVVLVGGLVIGGLGILRVWPVLARQTSLTDVTSLMIRREYAAATGKMIGDQMLWGRGLGTFEAYYPLYRDARQAAYTGEPSRNFRIQHPHNEHLELLAEGGIVGYGLFLWLVIGAIWRLLRASAPVERGLALSLLAMLIEGLLTQNLRSPAIAPFFWVVVGCANMPSLDSSTGPAKTVRSRWLKRIGIILMSIILLAGMRYAIRLAHADMYTKGGMHLYAVGLYQPARQWFHQAFAHDAHNKHVLYMIIRTAQKLDDHAAVMAYGQRMLAAAPFFLDTNYYLAQAAFAQGNVEQAEAYLLAQIHSNNLHWEAYYDLARLAFCQGRSRKGSDYCAELERIHAITPLPESVYQEIGAWRTQGAADGC